MPFSYGGGPGIPFTEIVPRVPADIMKFGCYPQDTPAKIIALLKKKVTESIGRTPTNAEIIQELNSSTNPNYGGRDYITEIAARLFTPFYISGTKISRGTTEKLYFELECEFKWGTMGDRILGWGNGTQPYSYSTTIIKEALEAICPSPTLIFSPLIQDTQSMMGSGFQVMYDMLYDIQYSPYYSMIDVSSPSSSQSLDSLKFEYEGYSIPKITQLKLNMVDIVSGIGATLQQISDVGYVDSEHAYDIQSQIRNNQLIRNGINSLADKKCVICVSLDYASNTFNVKVKTSDGTVLASLNDTYTYTWSDWVYDPNTEQWTEILHTDVSSIFQTPMQNYDFMLVVGTQTILKNGWTTLLYAKTYVAQVIAQQYQMDPSSPAFASTEIPSIVGDALFSKGDFESNGCIITPRFDRASIKFLPDGFLPIDESTHKIGINNVLSIFNQGSSGGR